MPKSKSVDEPAEEPAQEAAATVPYRIATYACTDCDVLTTIGESTHPFTGRPDIAAVSVLCPISGHPMFLVSVAKREVAEAPSPEIHALAAREAAAFLARPVAEAEPPGEGQGPAPEPEPAPEAQPEPEAVTVS